jgi:hypothetical protein
MTDYQSQFDAIRAELVADGQTPLANALSDWAGSKVGVHWKMTRPNIGYWLNIEPTAEARRKLEVLMDLWGAFGRHAPICAHGGSVALTLPWPNWKHGLTPRIYLTQHAIEVWQIKDKEKVCILCENYREDKCLSLALTLACKAAWEHSEASQ